ncbi:MAG: hypothetical protein AB1698_17610 [Pseudomonadota bacterium]
MRKTPLELMESPLLIERIEGALVVAAYLVVRHGPKFAPIVERLERELEAARREDPVARAQRILENFRERARAQGSPPLPDLTLLEEA